MSEALLKTDKGFCFLPVCTLSVLLNLLLCDFFFFNYYLKKKIKFFFPSLCQALGDTAVCPVTLTVIINTLLSHVAV